ncbi:C2 domain-containing protein [Capsaspora owczarzaki ATCC 30864]|uniref:Phosphatidylserine decarboxylase proenzyme 2 n=1 Tax=Capsaspora owczarzaki (strain ATCC 30864) TaxID=595528 RepID=A0A0D2WKE4_CAPO3|nr:C2 domain-containing protein [Capsaspora owczarzaki ATCC 30864]KJE90710.1 C2 domain-containing protein [Capsaspora owczarzaki ATCC 30864]|eukprot:XP_004364842.2 C2 domain-containing protein [Capsaspora owczarzaki ATCC 30864]
MSSTRTPPPRPPPPASAASSAIMQTPTALPTRTKTTAATAAAPGTATTSTTTTAAAMTGTHHDDAQGEGDHAVIATQELLAYIERLQRRMSEVLIENDALKSKSVQQAARLGELEALLMSQHAAAGTSNETSTSSTSASAGSRRSRIKQRLVAGVHRSSAGSTGASDHVNDHGWNKSTAAQPAATGRRERIKNVFHRNRKAPDEQQLDHDHDHGDGKAQASLSTPSSSASTGSTGSTGAFGFIARGLFGRNSAPAAPAPSAQSASSSSASSTAARTMSSSSQGSDQSSSVSETDSQQHLANMEHDTTPDDASSSSEVTDESQEEHTEDEHGDDSEDDEGNSEEGSRNASETSSQREFARFNPPRRPVAQMSIDVHDDDDEDEEEAEDEDEDADSHGGNSDDDDDDANDELNDQFSEDFELDEDPTVQPSSNPSAPTVDMRRGFLLLPASEAAAMSPAQVEAAASSNTAAQPTLQRSRSKSTTTSSTSFPPVAVSATSPSPPPSTPPPASSDLVSGLSSFFRRVSSVIAGEPEPEPEPEPPKQHVFSTVHRKRPTWCDVCGALLWSFGRASLTCEDCGMFVHMACKERAGVCDPEAAHAQSSRTQPHSGESASTGPGASQAPPAPTWSMATTIANFGQRAGSVRTHTRRKSSLQRSDNAAKTMAEAVASANAQAQARIAAGTQQRLSDPASSTALTVPSSQTSIASTGSTSSTTSSASAGSMFGRLDDETFLLRLVVVGATNLPKKDFWGTVDPYCIISFADTTYKTRVVRNNRNPVWNQRLLLLVRRTQAKFHLVFTVYDHDYSRSNDYVGYAVITTLNELCNTRTHEMELPLFDAQKDDVQVGSLQVKLEFMKKQQLEVYFWTRLVSFFDHNASNSLEIDELSMLLDALGCDLELEQVHHIFELADTNKDGHISPQELAAVVASEATGHSLIQFERCPVCKQSLPKDDHQTLLHIASCLETDPSSVDDFVMGGFLTSSYACKGWVKKLFGSLTYGRYSLTANNGNILVINRATGLLEEEEIPPHIRLSLRLIYQSRLKRTGGTLIMSNMLKMLRHLTVKQGRKFDDPLSVKHIAPFIRYHHLNMSEFIEPAGGYKTFNEFFYRQLVPGARPLEAPDNPSIALSPADARSNYFPTIHAATDLWIKGDAFTLPTLLDDPVLARRFEGGSLAIFRLAPQDYHRFHIPVNGYISRMYDIEGEYMTVNPMAIRQPDVNVYTENRRQVTLFETSEFGTVVYVSIGATLVGSIAITRHLGETVKRGEEFGYFAFGGSTLVLLFEPGRIIFDEDLMANSGRPVETLVRVGTSFGRGTVVVPVTLPESHQPNKAKAPLNEGESSPPSSKASHPSLEGTNQAIAVLASALPTHVTLPRSSSPLLLGPSPNAGAPRWGPTDPTHLSVASTTDHEVHTAPHQRHATPLLALPILGIATGIQHGTVIPRSATMPDFSSVGEQHSAATPSASSGAHVPLVSRAHGLIGRIQPPHLHLPGIPKVPVPSLRLPASIWRATTAPASVPVPPASAPPASVPDSDDDPSVYASPSGSPPPETVEPAAVPQPVQEAAPESSGSASSNSNALPMDVSQDSSQA